MNVVYASNDNYARHLAVSLCSLLDHNRDIEEIRVYLLSVGMSAECREKLERMVTAFHRSVEVIELGNLEERFSHEVDTGGFDISIMARLFIGEVLPTEISRVLYLDCDTVVLGSLSRLWTARLEGRILGAVMEPTIYPAVKERIGLGKDMPYYNSGVLLIDLEQWRREKAGRLLLDFYKSMGGNLFAGDQDTINGALKGRVKPLPPRYNFFTNYRYFHYRDLTSMSPWYRAVSKEAFARARRRPAVLHYMGDERPWKAGNLNHYRKAYEIYLERTPWAGTPKEKGSRVYMLMYHLMDYVTFLCPPVRLFISRRFGIKAVDSRRKP